MDICIVSGGTHVRFPSAPNHAAFAARNGHAYRHDLTPYEGLLRPNFHKIRAVEAALHHHEWVMWMDDDAFFTDMDASFDRYLDPEAIFVACKSPITNGMWVYLNSGVFFLRSCPDSFAFLRDVQSTSKDVIDAWHDPERVGLYTHGEQIHIIYALLEQGWGRLARLHPHTAFNARPVDWEPGAPMNALPVVHFPGNHDDKAGAMAAFAARYGLDESLLVRHPQDAVA